MINLQTKEQKVTKKFNQEKHSLSWNLSCRLSDLDSESQENLVRELLQAVSLKKIKEIKKTYFTNKGANNE